MGSAQLLPCPTPSLLPPIPDPLQGRAQQEPQLLFRPGSSWLCRMEQTQWGRGTRSILATPRAMAGEPAGLCHKFSFRSPSFRRASRRASSVEPRPENCTVMPWGLKPAALGREPVRLLGGGPPS